MPYYEYKGNIGRVLYPLPIALENGGAPISFKKLCEKDCIVKKYIILYFKIDKSNIVNRNKFNYIVCPTYNGYPNSIPVIRDEIYDMNCNINPLPEPFPLPIGANFSAGANPPASSAIPPDVKLCILYKINEDYYLRIFVPKENNVFEQNLVTNLKPNTYVEVVFFSDVNACSDNIAALITLSNEF
jgi:hypothetical protein